MKLQILPRGDVGNFQRREFRSYVRQTFQLIRSQRAVPDFGADHVAVGRIANTVDTVFSAKVFKPFGIAFAALQQGNFLREALQFDFLGRDNREFFPSAHYHNNDQVGARRN